MKSLLRWTGYIAGGLAASLLLAMLVVYALSERELRRSYEVHAAKLAVSTDSAAGGAEDRGSRGAAGGRE